MQAVCSCPKKHNAPFCIKTNKQTLMSAKIFQDSLPTYKDLYKATVVDTTHVRVRQFI